jgi:hypothetical protein
MSLVGQAYLGPDIGLVGLAGQAPSRLDLRDYVEYVLPSLDQIDVVFKTGKVCVAVEVKSSLSDSFPEDYKRGLYQVIKYDALLRAMALAGAKSIPSEINSFLVLESSLPGELRSLAQILGVTVIENVQIGKHSR